MILLVLLILPTTPTLSFVLEGSDLSYAKFLPWQHRPNHNNTLLLEFNTNQPDGLILYTDDHGDVDFFELKLVEGGLRLRYNLGEGTQLINVGRHLNDGLWHRVEVRVGQETSLTVDGFVTQSRGVKDERFETSGGIYIGGLPSVYNNRLSELSLPSVVFEPRFRGAVRNVVFEDSSGSLRPQELVEWKGLVSTPGSESCERHDPCLHGGFCISTDSGPICDCKHIDFEGANCEKDKSPVEARFHGGEYVGYDFRESGGEPIVSTLDEVSFSFRARYGGQHDGLLFYSGDSIDYLALTLRDGRITISINLGSGPLDARIHPDQLRFDDDQWHSVRVHRKIQEMSKTTSLCHITASVDGIHFDRWTLAGSFTLLSSNRVTIGGYDMVRPLPGIKGVTNFIGCLRKVEYRADTLRLSLLELARQGNRLVSLSGRLTWECGSGEGHKSVVAATSTSSSSSSEVMKSISTVTFTTPESFVILPRVNTTRSLSLSVKLRTTEPNGVLVYSKSDSGRRENFLCMELIEGQLYIHLETLTHLRIQATTDPINDGEWHQIRFIRNGRSGTVSVDEISTDFNTKGTDLELAQFYVGGVTEIRQEQVWSINLKYGFVGCLRSLTVNDMSVDLGSIAQQQDIGSVRLGCHVGSAGQCGQSPCLNNGRCKDGWGRFYCECGGSGSAGVVCQEEVLPLVLDGSKAITLSNVLTSPTHSNEISLRFKTQRSNGVILTLSGPSDFIELSLEQSRLKLRLRMSDREKILQTGSNLHDNHHHLLKFDRRGNLIRLKLDDIPPVTSELLTKNWSLFITKIQSGSVTNPFTGKIDHLTINNEQLLKTKPTPVDIVNIQNYVGVGQLRIYSGGKISLLLKSTQDGIIFYNGGISDFISMEILNSKLLLTFDNGGGSQTIQSGDIDDQWHFVEIYCRFGSSGNVSMYLDGKLEGESQVGGGFLDLNGVLYLGGLPPNMYQNLKLPSTTGFHGCLASLELGGEYINLLTDALVNPTGVVKGCTSTTNTQCTTDTCKNGGICKNNECDCDMTAYTGGDCAMESTTYEFTTGHLTYKSHHLKHLKIALGLLTTANTGLVLRIESKTTTDYLSVEISQGKLKLKLNFNTKEHLLTIDKRISDRLFHVVTVQKIGDVLTFTLDGSEVRRKVSGNLDGPTLVSVGGYNRKYFQGLISGLVINTEKILEMAKHHDPRIKTHGNAKQIMSISQAIILKRDELHYMQKTTASLTPTNDDLISSGDVKCVLTDDEDCVPNSGMTTDDLITPVYVPSVRPKTTTIMTTTNKFGCHVDDEDDCFEHSGDHSVTTGSTTSTQGSTATSTSTDVRYDPVTNATTTIILTPSTTTTKATTTTTTTMKTSTSTRFVPPHPPSLTPYVVPPGRDFDFDNQVTTTTSTTTTDSAVIYVAEGAGDSTLIIIIIIAVLMIIIVSILIIFFMCKRRDDPIYKVAELKFEPRPLPPTAPQQQLGPRKTGVKEWYV